MSQISGIANKTKPAVCDDCHVEKPKAKITREKLGTEFTLWLCTNCLNTRQDIFARSATISRPGEALPGACVGAPVFVCMRVCACARTCMRASTRLCVCVYA